MPGIILYAVGSPLVVDAEASLARAGLRLVAGVKNVESSSFLLDRAKLVDKTAVTESMRNLPFVVPLFTPENRRKAVEEAFSLGFKQPYSLIDPSVPPLHAVRCAPGLFINCGSAIGAACRFEEFVLINRGANVGHHSRLSRFVSIGPGAVLSGNVTINEGTMIGAGAVILPRVTIGANTIVGAGAVAVRDLPDNCVAVGNPARVLRYTPTGLSR